MRGPILGALLLGLIACGGGGGNGDGGDDSNADGNNLIDAVVATCNQQPGTNVTARLVENVTEDAALLVTSPPGDRRKFIVVRSGQIRIMIDDQIIDPPFLDISGPVDSGGEMGLLGLAFHPDYAVNRKFYVFYTGDGLEGAADIVDEFLASATDPNVADTSTRREILSVPDFAGNHNGGMIEFGSDGFLYIGMGDGGNANDPQETGQDLNRLLGKMLRIDVDTSGGGRNYGIPPGNPYAAGGGAPEVFIYGLRNPWRWSFDTETDDIYIGDVGQGLVEEVSVIPLANAAGTDLGWDDCEGTNNFEGSGCASVTGNRLAPVYEQRRPPLGGSDWQSVIGGQVYRGSCYPDLVGRYFFTDYNHGGLYSFVYAGGQATDVVEHTRENFPSDPTSLHADATGELYLTTEPGGVYHIEVQ